MWWWVATALAVEVVGIGANPPPVIDGHLDESVWSLATPVTDFQRYQPTAGEGPAGTTEVHFLQDAETLYIGIRVRDSPQPVRARMSEREAINADDQIGLYLDPFGDAQAGYIFYTNAIGIQQDLQFNAGSWNPSWSTVYKTRGTVTEDGRGYDLEIALPFRSIKYPGGQSVQQWGLILTRKIPGEGAKYGYPELVRGHPRLFTQAAPLTGVRPPGAGSGVELIPGITLRAASARPDTASKTEWTDLDPWYDPIRPFLNVRAGISPNMTLLGAINPDFSEVESDVAPVVLNARFAFRFDERRPFFTEGDGFFRDPHGTLYSRSIAEPLYGVKLAGREGPWSVGVLHAADRSPVGSVHEDGTPGFDDPDGRWATNTLLRIQRDLPGAGSFGLTFADKHLVNAGFRPTYGRLPDYAGHDSLGLDVTVPLSKRWSFVARHAQSWTEANGSTLGGSSSGMSVTRPAGEGLGMGIDAAFLSEGYRREIGFLTQSGYATANGQVDWTIPGKGLLSFYRPRLGVGFFEELDGQHYRSGSLSQVLLLGGVHEVYATVGVGNRRERSGEVDDTLLGWWVRGGYTGQIGQWVDLSPEVYFGRVMDFRDLSPAFRLTTSLDTTIRPINPMRIDLLGRYQRLTRVESTVELPDQTHDLLVRGRVRWQLHRDWGVRVIMAYNVITEREPMLESSVLLRWLPHPFTAIYLGYAERTQVGNSGGTLNRSLFTKLHVLLRPDRLRKKRQATSLAWADEEVLDAQRSLHEGSVDWMQRRMDLR